jgi:hypothetical protein
MAVEIVGTGQPDGTSLGRATTEKVGLYGEAVVQPTMSVAVGTDLATVILELAEIRAALVGVGIIDA